MRWPRWLARARWDRERARELESYLEIETADNVARGMSAGDARDAARRTLGNLTRIREEIQPSAVIVTTNTSKVSTGRGLETYCPLKMSPECQNPQPSPLTRIGCGTRAWINRASM